MEAPKWNSVSGGTGAIVLEEEEQGRLYAGGVLCGMGTIKEQHLGAHGM